MIDRFTNILPSWLAWSGFRGPDSPTVPFSELLGTASFRLKSSRCVNDDIFFAAFSQPILGVSAATSNNKFSGAPHVRFG